jgi:hypothetical protein
MKNQILLLIATTFFLFACNSTAQKAPQKSKSDGLQLDLVKGEEYAQNASVSSTVLQEINGQEVSMKIKMSSVVLFTVDVMHNHYYEMQGKFVSLSMTVESGQGSATFSSDFGDDLLSQIFNKIKNKPFTLMIAKTGKVMEVKNVKNIYLLAMDELKIPEATKAQVMQQIEQIISDEALKGSIEMFSGIYPEQPAKEGEKWTGSVKVGFGATSSTNVEVSYECTIIEDDVAYINSTATFESLNNEEYVHINGQDLKVNMAGTLTSEIIVDRQTGWVKSLKMVQKNKGTVTIKQQNSLIVPSSSYITVFVNDQY